MNTAEEKKYLWKGVLYLFTVKEEQCNVYKTRAGIKGVHSYTHFCHWAVAWRGTYPPRLCFSSHQLSDLVYKGHKFPQKTPNLYYYILTELRVQQSTRFSQEWAWYPLTETSQHAAPSQPWHPRPVPGTNPLAPLRGSLACSLLHKLRRRGRKLSDV